MERYGVEVGELGKGGRDGASEGAIVKDQKGEGCEIAKLERHFSAQILILAKNQPGEG